jgi:hypothetical protein
MHYRRNLMRRWACWSAALLIFCAGGAAGAMGAAPAAATQPAVADYSSPKAAARSFVQALAAGDSAGARAAVIANPQQLQSVDLLAMMAGSMKKLTDAAVAKFGDAGEAIAGQHARLEENLKQIEEAQVQINGDAATLASADQKQPVTLKKQDGQWKVDMGSMPGTEQLTQAAGAIRAMAKAATDTAGEINADQYKTVDAARDAFQKKMMAALLVNMPHPATHPATEPATMP